MTRILFICHGNICRSPMAKFVMKDLVKKAGLESRFQIESAATSTEETGNPVYPPARPGGMCWKGVRGCWSGYNNRRKGRGQAWSGKCLKPMW